jgi:hypothetical protein
MPPIFIGPDKENTGIAVESICGKTAFDAEEG